MGGKRPQSKRRAPSAARARGAGPPASR
jgi:hypothetical protein